MPPLFQRVFDVTVALAGRARRTALVCARRGLAWARAHPWRATALVPALLLLYVLALVPFTPSIGDLRKARTEVPSKVVSADGVVLAEYRRINREWVPLAQVSPHVIDALIATEDRRFYQHRGIDVYRTVGALLRTLGGDLQGGSTLTQQLARNLYPREIGRAVSVNRKIKEAITALKIEALYTKPEILETYLNTVPFLYNAFGIEMAARTYFDKSAARLDVLEAATLIGMLKGTHYYNPVLNPERARQRRNLVLTQLVAAGKLPAAQAERLGRRPLGLDFERQDEASGPAPHVAQQLRRWLIAWADRRNYDILADGLVVHTTIDARLQKAAQQAVVRQLTQLQRLADQRHRARQKRPARGAAPLPEAPLPQLQAGLLAIDPRNGQVRAWVGSRDFAQEQFDHVSQARRQPGSTFKPFVYGAAFMQGIGPQQVFYDQSVSIAIPGAGVWSPTDDAPPTGEPMTLAQALALSKNTITAQLVQQVGPAAVAQLARNLGVRTSRLEEVLSLALGTSPVTLREMVTAYGTLANAGQYVEPMLVLRVEDRHGRVLESFEPVRDAQPAMPRADALTLVHALRGAIDYGTGAAIRSRWGISADVAGKTGTTQDYTDGWFVLMHPQLVAGARVGFNDPAFRMGAWGQGAGSALPMVGELFQQALRLRAIDEGAEFDIPRWRSTPAGDSEAAPTGTPGDATPGADPLGALVEQLLGRMLKGLQSAPAPVPAPAPESGP